jgi:hypothetical protein
MLFGRLTYNLLQKISEGLWRFKDGQYVSTKPIPNCFHPI